ncbi:polysaccharide pyruvyl transferase family protein [Methylobacillus gramineus]|uniref:polysaccharide pyruvyl transferase family protein n=1 Tax=Methylobacillus gramineus TaxID=755169 RepID=UPI001CFF9D2A|nr:polysaccharide pyruvyl transferase family protein [Methylobacillus gramineus]MCB5184118.1 polysaccharide pyruvyl transferase family protein [Methylobacillus gramineus]
MKVLQIGSFSGNVGDIANHYGFRNWFQGLLGKIQWDEFEIRNVYRKNVAFDNDFVATVNQYDLVVVGGGNFFELWVDSSPTGTSISIEIEMFEKIKVPVFFNALGVDDGLGCSDKSLARFTNFLEVLTSSRQYLVSVRNDGAMATLKKRISNNIMVDKVLPLPDGGFFVNSIDTLRDIAPNAQIKDPVTIGINLAGDMLETRYPGGSGEHDYSGFISEFSDTLAEMWSDNKSLRFIFFPHIYSDLKVYADILSRLPDACRRENVKVAGYETNVKFEDTLFSEYGNCTLILGMRFHANVVAIANHVPVIGLYSYKQIKELFCELGIEEKIVDVRQINFKKELLRQYKFILGDLSKAHGESYKILSDVKEKRDLITPRVVAWLEENKLK